MCHFTITVPAWLEHAALPGAASFATVAQRMAWLIELARENIRQGTGGPFAAAVFRLDTGACVARGVNLVETAGCALAHAEIVALARAQQALGEYDLSAPGLPAHALYTTTEPCAMCLGAVGWAGVVELVCGARDADARAVGFDEGDKPARWWARLAARGIAVQRDVLRSQARRVLEEYRDRGGLIYNPGGRV